MEEEYWSRHWDTRTTNERAYVNIMEEKNEAGIKLPIQQKNVLVLLIWAMNNVVIKQPVL